MQSNAQMQICKVFVVQVCLQACLCFNLCFFWPVRFFQQRFKIQGHDLLIPILDLVESEQWYTSFWRHAVFIAADAAKWI
jgi:hypothetical protein